MTVRRKNFCGSPEHALDRRGFLGRWPPGPRRFAADMTGLNVLADAGPGRRTEEAAEARHPAVAGRRAPASWRPGTRSPARRTGGPFRAIPTDVPGHRTSPN